ncbi:MAG TPA: putative zinc-binding metallopeptidase [Gemmatimonadaceae bacterium]|nr:putative zinc-binding metallopeptidase [Gemmatimonadaceae bacterium]
MHSSADDLDGELRELLGSRISELGLSLRDSPVEQLVAQLYVELERKGVRYHPPVYLSDEWGCPEGTPLIGIPFYLADPRLSRIEQRMAMEVEGETEIIKILRHEAGHAINYAYRLHDRADWRQTFGPYSRPYRDRFRADPFSRSYVRHLPGWYAQKHPDEDFAETFAVWMTPGIDWRALYEGWEALQKLDYVDSVLGELGSIAAPIAPAPGEHDVPVEVMHYTVAEHYRECTAPVPVEDERHFDGDLRTLFAAELEAPGGESAAAFLHRHRREIVTRIAYWTGENAPVVRTFLDLLSGRAEALGLRVRGLEASTLIEVTAFGTAVMMNHRYTDAMDPTARGRPEE